MRLQEMISQSLRSVKESFLSILREFEHLDATEKADMARRFGELVAIALRQLNREKHEWQKEELEHFSELLQFRGEMVSVCTKEHAPHPMLTLFMILTYMII